MCSCELFSDDNDLDVCEDTLVALDLSIELTDFLDFGKGDVLLVNLDVVLSIDCCDLSCGYRTVKLAILTDLDNYLDGNCGDGSSLGLSLSYISGLFVSPLAYCLLVLLESGSRSYRCKSLRNEIIESVTGLDFYHITGLAEIGNFFLKDDFHNASII